MALQRMGRMKAMTPCYIIVIGVNSTMKRVYCLMRLRPASMRKKMKSKKVKPQSDDPP